MRAVPRSLREGAYALVRRAWKSRSASCCRRRSQASSPHHPRVLSGRRRDDGRDHRRRRQSAVGVDPLRSGANDDGHDRSALAGRHANDLVEFKVLFAVAMTLFVLTLGMNIIAQWVSRRSGGVRMSTAVPTAGSRSTHTRIRARRALSVAFMVIALLAITISMLMLGALIVEIAVDGAARLFTDGSATSQEVRGQTLVDLPTPDGMGWMSWVLPVAILLPFFGLRVVRSMSTDRFQLPKSANGRSAWRRRCPWRSSCTFSTCASSPPTTSSMQGRSESMGHPATSCSCSERPRLPVRAAHRRRTDSAARHARGRMVLVPSSAQAVLAAARCRRHGLGHLPLPRPVLLLYPHGRLRRRDSSRPSRERST